jgi:hypothetical protein
MMNIRTQLYLTIITMQQRSIFHSKKLTIISVMVMER